MDPIGTLADLQTDFNTAQINYGINLVQTAGLSNPLSVAQVAITDGVTGIQLAAFYNLAFPGSSYTASQGNALLTQAGAPASLITPIPSPTVSSPVATGTSLLNTISNIFSSSSTSPTSSILGVAVPSVTTTTTPGGTTAIVSVPSSITSSISAHPFYWIAGAFLLFKVLL